MQDDEPAQGSRSRLHNDLGNICVQDRLVSHTRPLSLESLARETPTDSRSEGAGARWVLADHWSRNDEEAFTPQPYPWMLGASKRSGGSLAGIDNGAECVELGGLVRRCFQNPHGEDCVNPEQARRLASTIGEQVVALAQTDEVVYNTELLNSLSSVEVHSVLSVYNWSFLREADFVAIKWADLPNHERGCCYRCLPNSEGMSST